MRWLLPALLVCSLTGCASIYDSIERFVADDNHLISCEEHPWHSVPGSFVATVVTCVVLVPLLPVFLAETAIFDQGVETGHQVSKLVAGTIGCAVGSAVALPLFIVGLPWEFGGSGTPQPASRPTTR